MEPVEVTARFGIDGKIVPLNITWRQKGYKVTSVGRSWENETGRHILVMTPGDRVFELVFVPAECHWYILDLGSDRSTS